VGGQNVEVLLQVPASSGADPMGSMRSIARPHKTVCAAWALALCAATVDAFMPAGAPAHQSLRPAAAVSAKESHTKPACGPLVCGKRAPALSMASTMGRGNGEDSVADENSVGMASVTYAKSIDTLFDLPRAVHEATDIEAMSPVVRV
jgi:hypothetical protein